MFEYNVFEYIQSCTYNKHDGQTYFVPTGQYNCITSKIYTDMTVKRSQDLLHYCILLPWSPKGIFTIIPSHGCGYLYLIEGMTGG